MLVWVLRVRTVEVEGTGARNAVVRPRPPTRMQAVRMVGKGGGLCVVCVCVYV